jgi:hypothetical protein
LGGGVINGLPTGPQTTDYYYYHDDDDVFERKLLFFLLNWRESPPSPKKDRLPPAVKTFYKNIIKTNE